MFCDGQKKDLEMLKESLFSYAEQIARPNIALEIISSNIGQDIGCSILVRN
jgi:hypothetical protein